MTRSDLCTRIFYGLMELAVFIGVTIAITWWIQSREPILQFEEDPGYAITAITRDYIEVQWKKASLVADCPGLVHPAIVGEHATETLAPYPFIVEHTPKTFSRRYVFPSYFPPGEYELRITLTSHCNPLFTGRQILRVPFHVEAAR